MKLVNLLVRPPFYWINQWRHCGETGVFSPLMICCERNDTGGFHIEIAVIVLGLGFVATWYDRNSRAAFLAQMDQLESEVKDDLRQSMPDLIFDGEDDE